MSKELFQVFFVVLRESMEALFVVAMLNACIGRMPRGDRAQARWSLWAGVAAGIALSAAIGYALMSVSELLDGDGLDYFQCGMMLAAALMMLQTAFWIGRRSLPRVLGEPEKGAAVTVGVLCALAVAREGSETAVFMYGVLLAADKAINLSALLAAGMAFLTSAALFALVQLSSRAIARALFFRICEFVFFVIAGSLMLGAIDRLIALGLVPTLSPPLWDTSRILDDHGWVGGLVSSLTGYRSRPELIVLLVLGLYWSAIIGLLRIRSHQPATR